MRSLAPVLIASTLLLISGCNEGPNDPRPVDGRSTDGAYEPEPLKQYEGRVIDGYLTNARVWLDLDGDYQYDEGAVSVVVASRSGCSVTMKPSTAPAECLLVLPGGEPTAMSGEAGRFSLDVEMLQLGLDQGANLDPRNYPLVAVAIPGKTREETTSGVQVIERAFRLTAAPGNRFVTPLTTIDDALRRTGMDLFGLQDGKLADRLSGINLAADYLRDGNQRGRAYAEAIAQYLKAQFPDELEGEVVASDGRLSVFDARARQLLSLGLLNQARDVIMAVDRQAESVGYEQVESGSLALPDAALDLSDPYLVSRVQVHSAPGGVADSASVIEKTENRIAELFYQYRQDGRLLAVASNGCLQPSLYELARLARNVGYPAELNTQALLGFYLDHETSRTFYDDGGVVDEQLTFDWAARSAEFQSTTSCHGDSNGSELGGAPEATFSWQADPEGVAVTSGSGQTLTLLESRAADPFFGMNTSRATSRTLDAELVECPGSVSENDEGAGRVITGQQSYTYTADVSSVTGSAIPGDGTLMSVSDWDTRNGFRQLLAYTFFDTTISSSELLKWEFRYRRSPVSGETVQNEGGLVLDARLVSVPDNTVTSCGNAISLSTGSVLAHLSYEYSRLSEIIQGKLGATAQEE